jgi:hypothetical protein
MGIYPCVHVLYFYNYHSTGHCLLFKTRRLCDWILQRVQLSRFHLKTETESSLRNVVLNERQDDG